MTAQSERDDLSAVIAQSAQAVALIDLSTHLLVQVSASAADMLRGSPQDVIGRRVEDLVAEQPTGALLLLATGKLDGFEAHRFLRCLDGTTISAYVWAHALGLDRPARYAALLISDADHEPPGAPAIAASDTRVIGTVDSEWRIDRISSDVQLLLGYQAADLFGKSLLGGIHPNDVPELLTGLGHAHSKNLNAIVRVRVRRADDTWLLCRARVAPLDQPPCFAFTLRRLTNQSKPTPDRLRDLELLLTQIGHDVLAAGITIPSKTFPTLASRPELAQLSSREWEVVLRLVEGRRVPSIAKELSLSQSTVRNHLSAVFRKLQVGSQAELLDHFHELDAAAAAMQQTA